MCGHVRPLSTSALQTFKRNAAVKNLSFLCHLCSLLEQIVNDGVLSDSIVMCADSGVTL